MIRKRILPLLALVWLVAIALSYALVHNPLTGRIALALGRALLDVLAVGLLAALAGALGTLLLPDLKPFSTLEQAGLRVLIGLGLLSAAVLILGMLSLFPPRWLAWLVMLGLLILLHRQLWAWGRILFEGLREVSAPEPDRFALWLRRGAILLLALAAILALAPPTKWDALTYHLAGPRLYLEAGRISSFPENHFLSFPQLVETLYLWLMILARPQAAALLHGGFGLLLIFLLLGFSRRVGRPSAAWVAIVTLLVSDSLWGEFAWPYNDLSTMAYIFASLVVLLIWHEVGHTRLLIWAGVFVGLAMGTKYTAAGAALGVGLLAVYLARRGGVAHVLRACGMVIIPALLVFAPWLIKNAILDGNPVAPFLWGTPGFDASDQWYYLRPGTGLDPLALSVAPLQGTVFGREGLAPFGASSGALLLGLLPLAAVAWRRRTAAEQQLIMHLLVFVLSPYLLWLGGAAVSWFLVQTRLLFPIFPVLALIGALGLASLRDLEVLPHLRKLAQAVTLIVLTLAVLSATLAFVQHDPLPVVVGLQSEAAFLSERLPAHAAAMQEIDQLPVDARVLMLWEPRTFYCPRECLPDSLINRWWHDRQLEPDPLAIATHWRVQGVTHVLIFESGLHFLVTEEPHEPLTADDLAALDTLRQQVLLPIWQGGDVYTLYELSEGNP